MVTQWPAGLKNYGGWRQDLSLEVIDSAVSDGVSVPSEQPGGDKQQQQSRPAQHHNLWQNLQ